MSMARAHYDEDAATFPADAYRVKGWEGVAFSVLGWETAPDKDTEWTGIESRTGKVLAVMVGDDMIFRLDPDELTPLKGSEYCRSCGQIGCHCNTVDDDE